MWRKEDAGILDEIHYAHRLILSLSQGHFTCSDKAEYKRLCDLSNDAKRKAVEIFKKSEITSESCKDLLKQMEQYYDKAMNLFG